VQPYGVSLKSNLYAYAYFIGENKTGLTTVQNKEKIFGIDIREKSRGTKIRENPSS
jgi:hypothetical protein